MKLPSDLHASRRIRSWVSPFFSAIPKWVAVLGHTSRIAAPPHLVTCCHPKPLGGILRVREAAVAFPAPEGLLEIENSHSTFYLKTRSDGF